MVYGALLETLKIGGSEDASFDLLIVELGHTVVYAMDPSWEWISLIIALLLRCVHFTAFWTCEL